MNQKSKEERNLKAESVSLKPLKAALPSWLVISTTRVDSYILPETEVEAVLRRMRTWLFGSDGPNLSAREANTVHP